jgi:hypothetical protein
LFWPDNGWELGSGGAGLGGVVVAIPKSRQQGASFGNWDARVSL